MRSPRTSLVTLTLADRILVSPNAPGVYNACSMPSAGGEPEPLTISTDRDAVP
jgi:hypothetical protein